MVVVDDGSTDPETQRALGLLERGGVRVIRQANTGVSAARVAGVAAARAPYVHSLDSDDMLAPGVLSRMADMLDGDPSLDAVWGNVEAFGEQEFVEVTWDCFDPWRITYVNEIPAAALIRRSSLLASESWQATGYEDWGLWMTAAERGWRGAKINEVTLRYRIQPVTRRLDLEYTMDTSNRADLRQRHRRLYEGRRANRRRSTSRAGVKLTWPVIDALPLISPLQKHRLLRFSRHLFEPQMRTGSSKLRILRDIRWRLLPRAAENAYGAERSPPRRR